MGALDLDERFAQEWGSSTSSHRACPIIRPARNVMSIWPDDWGNADNQQWANKLSWNLCSGSRTVTCAQTLGSRHTRAQLRLVQALPVHPEPRRRSGPVYFDVRTEQRRSQESDVDAKMRNFYKSLQYIKQYPTMEKMFDTMPVSEFTFHGQIMPTIYSAAEHINLMDPQLRFWQWNHCEHFQERVTCMCDGYPVRVGCPKNRFVQRLLKSGK